MRLRCRLRRRAACGRIRSEERWGAVLGASGGKIGHFSTLSRETPLVARKKPQVRSLRDFSAFLRGVSHLTKTIHRSPFSARNSGKVPDFARNDPSFRTRVRRIAAAAIFGGAATEVGGHIGLPTCHPIPVHGCDDSRNLHGSPACRGCSRLAESADRVLALAGRTAIGGGGFASSRCRGPTVRHEGARRGGAGSTSAGAAAVSDAEKPLAASPLARASGRGLREGRQSRSMDIFVHRPVGNSSSSSGATYETSTNRRHIASERVSACRSTLTCNQFLPEAIDGGFVRLRRRCISVRPASPARGARRTTAADRNMSCKVMDKKPRNFLTFLSTAFSARFVLGKTAGQRLAGFPACGSSSVQGWKSRKIDTFLSTVFRDAGAEGPPGTVFCRCRGKRVLPHALCEGALAGRTPSHLRRRRTKPPPIADGWRGAPTAPRAAGRASLRRCRLTAICGGFVSRAAGGRRMTPRPMDRNVHRP